MTTTIKQVKEMFYALSPTDQAELLKQLNGIDKTTGLIAEFTKLHQLKFRQSCSFSISQDDNKHFPTITAELQTSFGRFVGTGSNQKIAKLDAVVKANVVLEQAMAK